MKTFSLNPGVNSFETGSPDGSLLRIEAGKPLSTDDPAVISFLEFAGSHVLTISDAPPAPDKKTAAADKGGEQS